MLKKIRAAVTSIENIAVAFSAVALVGAFYLSVVQINVWAQTAFARPILASSLLAAIDVALFLVALALVQPLSRLIAIAIRRPIEKIRGR